MEWYLSVLIYFWLLVKLICFSKFWSFHISSLVISLFRLVPYFSFGFLKCFSCWYSYIILICSWLCLIDIANAFSHCVSCLPQFVCSDFWWIDIFMFWCQKDHCQCLLLPYSLYSNNFWALLLFSLLSLPSIHVCGLWVRLSSIPTPGQLHYFSMDSPFPLSPRYNVDFKKRTWVRPCYYPGLDTWSGFPSPIRLSVNYSGCQTDNNNKPTRPRTLLAPPVSCIILLTSVLQTQRTAPSPTLPPPGIVTLNSDTLTFNIIITTPSLPCLNVILWLWGGIGETLAWKWATMDKSLPPMV